MRPMCWECDEYETWSMSLDWHFKTICIYLFFKGRDGLQDFDASLQEAESGGIQRRLPQLQHTN